MALDPKRTADLAEQWVKSFGVSDGETELTKEQVIKDATALLKYWPRGWW
jgi:hypothetical protein